MKNARKQQTVRALDAVRARCCGWIEARQQLGRGQYDSQFTALERELVGAIGRIEVRASAIDTGPLEPAGKVNGRCVQLEKGIAWVTAVFDYFRLRFDQRDDPALASALRAADEVVWSCHGAIFSIDELRSRRGPTPLPFISGAFSPVAYTVEKVGGTVGKPEAAMDVFEGYLRKLPLPLIELPGAVLDQPWMLVFIGHEAGHIAEHGLGGPTMRDEFKKQIAAAVRSSGASEEQERAWSIWAGEIFADWVSVLTMGPEALWALAQVILDEDMAMLTPGKLYPAPWTRLCLVAALADRLLPGAGTAALESVGLDGAARAALSAGDAHAGFVVPVAKAVHEFEPSSETGTLDSLVRPRAEDFAPGGDISRWVDVMFSGQARTAETGKATVRNIIAGATAAARRAQATGDVLEDAAKTFARVEAHAEGGTRSGGPTVGATDGSLLFELAMGDVSPPEPRRAVG